MTPGRIPVTVERVDRLYPPWVASRVSNRTIYVRRDVHLTPRLLAHELTHVLQRDRLGPLFLGAYLAGWARAGFRYAGNALEAEARAAERDPVMLAWASDLISSLSPRG